MTSDRWLGDRNEVDGARREIEHKADLSRARLLGTIDELDRRRRELLDFRFQIRRHMGDLLAALGGLLIGAAATAAAVLYHERRIERRIRRERVRAVVRLWKHPERIAVQRSAVGTVLRFVLVALATMTTTTIGMLRIEHVRKRPRLPAHPSEPLGV